MNSLPAASSLLQPIVDAPLWIVLLLKITGVLLATWLAHLVLRRTNPRWRVFLWRVTAVGLITLPVVTWLFPALEIRVQQPPAVVSEPVAVDLPGAGSIAEERSSFLPSPAGRGGGGEGGAAEQVGNLLPPKALTLTLSQRARGLLCTNNAETLLLCVWLAGIVVLAFRLSVGRYQIRRLIGRTRPSPPAIQTECARVAQAIGCRSHVAVVQSDVPSPLLCGLCRPLLLLPPRMCDESYGKDLPGILAHELTHVRSHDIRWNLGLQSISIVLWFHPLVWRMRKAHLAACELVCDAASASFVGDAADYCRTLARVAVDACASLPAAGIAMARTSAISHRLRALRTRVFHLPLRRRSVLGVGVATLLGVTVIGALQFALTDPPVQASQDQSPRPSPPGATASKTDPLRAPAVDPQDKPLSTANATPAKTVHGKVVDDKGKPIAHADVWMMPAWNPAHQRWPTHATSDAEGRFNVPVSPFSDRDVKRTGRPYFLDALWAYAAGHQLNSANAANQLFGRDKSDVVLQLAPAAHTAFVILAPEGKPLAGALVEPDFVRSQTAAGGEPPEEARSAVAARTDANGQAILTALPRDALSSIRVIAEGFGIQTEQLTGLGPVPAGQPIRLRQAGRIAGRVTAARPECASGIRIVFLTGVASGTRGLAEVKSDEQGKFVVPAIAAGFLGIMAFVDDKLPILPRIADYGKRTMTVQAHETTSIEISLEPVVSVYGTVWARDTGKPIAKALIQVHYDGGNLLQDALVLSDGEGKFTAPVLPGRIQLEVVGVAGEAVNAQHHVLQRPLSRYEVPANVKEFQLPPLQLILTNGFPRGPSPENRKGNSDGSIKPGFRPLSIRVLDSDGKPIRNAGITVRGMTSLPFGPTRYRTNAEGGATIAVPKEEVRDYQILVMKDRYVTAGAVWKGDGVGAEVPEKFRFLLERGTAVGGIVRDAQGKPVAGVEVTVEGRKTSPGDPRWTSIYETVGTDGEGKWRAHRIPKDLTGFEIDVRLKRPDVAGVEHFDKTALPLDKLQAQIAVMVMHKGVALEGTVTDPQGKPAVGATVGLMPELFRGDYPRAKADQKGHYRFVVSAPGEYTLAAAAKDYAPDSRRVTVGTRPQTVDL